ncbi:hypothetical protein D915_011075 [Fasciola hepatica]|uniref:EH domain-containing protein n=1 Tax=Fasciola hepatica TaxID=6192 RepID=A0A4E0QVH2_FASHE|nr:hypothetical protein D915_011075 [Fasciola hepatica]
MERLQLREQEVVYYFDTFDTYDTENRGKIKIDGAEALFDQSGLPVGTLNKIIDLCGAHRFGYFGRIQFFMALKLISLAQSGYDVSLEALKVHGRDLPLPNFNSEVPLTSKCTTVANLEAFSNSKANPNTDVSDAAVSFSSIVLYFFLRFFLNTHRSLNKVITGHNCY